MKIIIEKLMENIKTKLFLETLLLILLFFSIFLIANLSFYEFKEFNFNVKPWIRDTYLLNYYDYVQDIIKNI